MYNAIVQKMAVGYLPNFKAIRKEIRGIKGNGGTNHPSINKTQMKVDFYKFQCFSIGYPYDVCKRTLAEAKEVYRQMKFKGYRLSCSIHGCTRDDDSIFLTFTPWWEDEDGFGRTILTYLGEKYLK